MCPSMFPLYLLYNFLRCINFQSIRIGELRPSVTFAASDAGGAHPSRLLSGLRPSRSFAIRERSLWLKIRWFPKLSALLLPSIRQGTMSLGIALFPYSLFLFLLLPVFALAQQSRTGLSFFYVPEKNNLPIGFTSFDAQTRLLSKEKLTLDYGLRFIGATTGTRGG